MCLTIGSVSTESSMRRGTSGVTDLDARGLTGIGVSLGTTVLMRTVLCFGTTEGGTMPLASGLDLLFARDLSETNLSAIRCLSRSRSSLQPALLPSNRSLVKQPMCLRKRSPSFLTELSTVLKLNKRLRRLLKLESPHLKFPLKLCPLVKL